MSPTPIDPFKVAENGLDTVYVAAKSQKQETIVTKNWSVYSISNEPESVGAA
jgi:hypothetical protein